MGKLDPFWKKQNLLEGHHGLVATALSMLHPSSQASLIPILMKVFVILQACSGTAQPPNYQPNINHQCFL